MPMSLEIKGLDDTQLRVGATKDGRFVANGRKAMTRALKDEADDILHAARMIVPVRTGHLKANSKTEILQTGRGQVSVKIFFFAEYAAAVHEQNFDYTSGRWKYLQEPVEHAMATGYADRLAERYRDHMRTLGHL